MSECPISDDDDYRVEVLIALRRTIERLDKDEYSEEERQEAEEIGDARGMRDPNAVGEDGVDPLMMDDDNLGGDNSNDDAADFDMDDMDYS